MEIPAERAIPFITFSEKQGFVLSKEAEDFLKSLDDSTKLGLISVVGKYRTGKSFFVNRVLLQTSNEGFAVGPTINPCTKGLWLWTKTLESENPEYDGLKVLLIDTEGFGGIDENVNHDSRIFLFSLLLSSYFIYNSVGNIDEQALNSLSLIINLAKDIQIKSHGSDNEKEDPASFFPGFLWVVRDFALKMVDSNGVAITPKDYLEKALELQKGVSDSIESKNRIRRLFKHFFRDRECLTLVRPIESEKDLQFINTMPDNQLREEFVDQIKQARKKIFKKIKPKMLNGQMLNASMLIELCKAYIQAMNTGNMPNIENAWSYLCKNESQKALNEALEELEKQFSFSKNDKGFDEISLRAKKTEVSQNIIKIFKKKALGNEEDVKEYISRLMSKMKEKFKEFKENNKFLWIKTYESIMQNKRDELENKIKNDYYSNLYNFQEDLNLLQSFFEKEAPPSDCKSTYISECILKLYKLGAENIVKLKEMESNKQIKTLEHRLLMSDNDLKNKKKDLEEERNNFLSKLNALEREKATAKVNESTLQEKIKELKQELEKNNQKNQENIENYKEISHKKEKDLLEKLKIQEEKFNNLRVSSQQTINELEKQNALLSQEMNFSKREMNNLQNKLETLDNENRRLKLEGMNQNNNLEKLKQKSNEIESFKNQEIGFLKNESEKKIKELSSELEKSKEIIKKHSELQVEKTYLESQVNFFKSQLDENKRLHDALLMALQQGINNNDNENTNELVETNRYLSAAMEKIEIRCKILEEKAEKLKNFKKMVKNSSSMQCLHCSKNITNAIFMQHVSSCLSELQKAQQQQQMPGSKVSQNKPTTSSKSIPPSSDLSICINQTMVKESADNKPFTEYLIQVTYNNNKWTTARKYKSFCDLYQKLYNSFPNLKFPDSVLNVMNSGTDMNNIFNSKRPTVIEDRRKGLQQFLRDLSKIDSIKNSKIFRVFLEIEKGEGSFTESNSNESKKNKMIVTSIANLNSQRDFKSVYSNIIDEKKNSKTNFSSNMMIDEVPGKEINLKIDKKMLPPSPSSFLNSWNQDKISLQNNIINKENKNPRSKSVSDNKCFNIPSDLINNPAQTLVNDEENDTDRIANIDVSNISSTLQADTQSFQEISNEKSILSFLKGENQGLTAKNSSTNYNNNEKFSGKAKNMNNQMDLYHSNLNMRPQSYYSRSIYSNKDSITNNQPQNSSYSSHYEKRKNEKSLQKHGENEKHQKNLKIIDPPTLKESRNNIKPQDRLSQLIPSSKTLETMTGRISEFMTHGYKQ